MIYFDKDSSSKIYKKFLYVSKSRNISISTITTCLDDLCQFLAFDCIPNRILISNSEFELSGLQKLTYNSLIKKSSYRDVISKFNAITSALNL